MVVIGLGKNLLFKSVLAHCAIQFDAFQEHEKGAIFKSGNRQSESENSSRAAQRTKESVSK